MSKLVRVNDELYSKLDQITRVTDYSRQDIIDKALERETILKQANEAYARVARNRKELQDIPPSLKLWRTRRKSVIYENLP